MKYNLDKIKGDWVDYHGAQVLIRPIPFSLFNAEELSEVENQRQVYEYALQDWKGFVDQDDKEIKFNKKNIALLFDFDVELRVLVVITALSGIKEAVEEVKK
jgi:hypothetical protein